MDSLGELRGFVFPQTATEKRNGIQDFGGEGSRYEDCCLDLINMLSLLDNTVRSRCQWLLGPHRS